MLTRRFPCPIPLLFSLLSSPSACVSPSDSTLTVENVTEVMGVVGNCMGVAGDGSIITPGLGVPDPKLQEIEQESSSERDKSHAVGGYWVKTDPDASWKKLAGILYGWEEDRAAAMARQYLPKSTYKLKFRNGTSYFQMVANRILHARLLYLSVYVYLLTIIILGLPCRRHDSPIIHDCICPVLVCGFVLYCSCSYILS